eukprot:Sspe_Gene.112846::Locus_96689_Transcript_1_1_Confidence_0.750_Length_455::g.112846::m.112846
MCVWVRSLLASSPPSCSLQPSTLHFHSSLLPLLLPRLKEPVQLPEPTWVASPASLSTTRTGKKKRKVKPSLCVSIPTTPTLCQIPGGGEEGVDPPPPSASLRWLFSPFFKKKRT